MNFASKPNTKLNPDKNTSIRLPVFSFCLIIFISLLMIATKFVLGSLLVAILISYIFNPFVESYERKGISRSAFVFVGLTIAVIFCFLVAWFLTPILVQQAEQLQSLIPAAVSQIEQRIIPFIIHKAKKLPMGLGNVFTGVLPTKLTDIVSKLVGTTFPTFFENLFLSTKFILSWLMTIILTPIFSFFVLRDFKKLIFRSISMVPPDLRTSFISFLRSLDLVLRGVLRGQIFVVLILSFLYTTAFVLCGLPAAVLVGICTGLARFIPYMDIVIGGTLASVLLITNNASNLQIIFVVCAFLFIQFLDVFFITPKIVGQYTGLPPLAIIIAILCFGDWLGFYGVLIAIPTAAVLRLLGEALISTYKHSQFFRNDVGFSAKIEQTEET
jgi:predicted PurR-regulated permease PerM